MVAGSCSLWRAGHENVAGYDVSRFVAGSLGTLGLIAEVSLELAPTPAHEITVVLETSQARALELLNRWAGQPLPLSATAWHDGSSACGFPGRRPGCAPPRRCSAANRRTPGSGPVARAPDASSGARSRLAPLGPSTTPPLELEGRQLLEWNGALRWLKWECRRARCGRPPGASKVTRRCFAPPTRALAARAPRARGGAPAPQLKTASTRRESSIRAARWWSARAGELFLLCFTAARACVPNALSGYRAIRRAYSWIEAPPRRAPALAAASYSSFCCASLPGPARPGLWSWPASWRSRAAGPRRGFVRQGWNARQNQKANPAAPAINRNATACFTGKV